LKAKKHIKNSIGVNVLSARVTSVLIFSSKDQRPSLPGVIKKLKKMTHISH